MAMGPNNVFTPSIVLGYNCFVWACLVNMSGMKSAIKVRFKVKTLKDL
jgi:hypothetical protein